MKLMFNEDWMHFIWSRHVHKVDVTEQVIKDFIYQYKGTQITDFAMNVNGTVSTAPSKIKEDFCDKYLAKEEHGVKVDYSDTYAQMAYELFVEKKLDFYKIWIETLKEIGINPWISVRVNDVHGNDNFVDVRKSSQVEAYPEKWRIRHREANGYYDKCQDFELEQVRKDFLGYIEEMFERYSGVYGLELDFTRQAYMFAPGREKEGREIANNLMKDIRALCDKYSVEKITVLVPAEYQTCLDYGLDPVAWAEKGYADAVVILSRWKTINTDYQIDLWKKLLGGKALLGTGQQMNFSAFPGAESIQVSVDMFFGQACANLYNGDEFVYVYNCMDMFTPDVDDGFYTDTIRNIEKQKMLFADAGEYESASRHKRTHVLSYDDHRPYWEKVSGRLPINFLGEGFEAIKIMTGGMAETETAELRLGFDKEIKADDIEVYVNRKKAEFKCYGEINPMLKEPVGHIFEIKTNDIGGYAVIEIKCTEKAVLKYVDITITP